MNRHGISFDLGRLHGESIGETLPLVRHKQVGRLPRCQYALQQLDWDEDPVVFIRNRASLLDSALKFFLDVCYLFHLFTLNKSSCVLIIGFLHD